MNNYGKIEHVLDSMQRTCKILDANYQKSDLSKVVSDSKHFSGNKQSMLRDVLNKYEFLFNGTLVNWKTRPVDVELQSGEKTYYSKPYPVPRAHKAVFC